MRVVSNLIKTTFSGGVWDTIQSKNRIRNGER
jgi:hypothetical protein